VFAVFSSHYVDHRCILKFLAENIKSEKTTQLFSILSLSSTYVLSLHDTPFIGCTALATYSGFER
jgi:hypothetical protein